MKQGLYQGQVESHSESEEEGPVWAVVLRIGGDLLFKPWVIPCEPREAALRQGIVEAQPQEAANMRK